MGRRIKSREKQTSKGERPNTNPTVLKAKRRDYMDAPFDRLNNQVKAWRAGKKVMVTIEIIHTHGIYYICQLHLMKEMKIIYGNIQA